MQATIRLGVALGFLAVAHFTSAPARATDCNNKKCINPWGCHSPYIDCHCDYWTGDDDCWMVPCTTGNPCQLPPPGG
jgi:hypothetical protein